MYIGVYIQIKKCTKHEYFYDAIPGHNKKQIRFPPIMTQKGNETQTTYHNNFKSYTCQCSYSLIYAHTVTTALSDCPVWTSSHGSYIVTSPRVL